MRNRVVFSQFSNSGVHGLQMAAGPLFSLGCFFLSLGFLVLLLPELLVFFVASVLIFFGLFFMFLAFKAWRAGSSNTNASPEQRFEGTQIIDK